MDNINKHNIHVLQNLRPCLFVSILICLLGAFLADDSMFDQDHLKKYPYCGRMSPAQPSNAPTARVVNSEPPEYNYRWALFIERKNWNLEASFSTYSCSGSVITNK